jgi:hypothetical protein
MWFDLLPTTPSLALATVRSIAAAEQSIAAGGRAIAIAPAH